MLSCQNLIPYSLLFLIPLLFVVSIPTYFLNFKFFNHSSTYSVCNCKRIQCMVDHMTGYAYIIKSPAYAYLEPPLFNEISMVKQDD